MKLVKSLTTLLALTGALFMVSCTTTESSKSASGSRRDVLYLCNCGADCKCTSVSTKPGKCGCGFDLKAGRVVRVEQDEALLCRCELSCTCSVDVKDLTKCGCGKPIRKVSLKGTGIYFCNCGGACGCNAFSDKPAQCKCGMQLKRVD